MGYNKTTFDFWQTPRPQCNCGSYALNVDEWFLPYDSGTERDHMIEDMRADGYDYGDVCDTLLDQDRDYILGADDSLIEISYRDYLKLPASVEVIAYRIGINDFYEDWDYPDDDFHFRVRRGGIWYEKTGIYDPQECPNQDITDPWITEEYWVNEDEHNIDEDEIDIDGSFEYNSDLLLFIHAGDEHYLTEAKC